jgi:hypothetical protein
VFRSVVKGLAAGAAGTTALNAATYVDMAVRGRPASSLPQQTVATMAERFGYEIPGEDEERENRLNGLGPLGGIATGVGIGVAAALFAPVITRLPAGFAAVLLGGAAMAATDGSMQQLGLVDPKTWSTTDWLSDAVPHLAYGIATVATLRRFAGR